MKLIVTGLKFLGKDHIQSQLDAIEKAVKICDATNGYRLVVGFDIVNEEDYNPGIDLFIEQILEMKQRMGADF